MKKKLILMVLSIVCLSVVAACGSSDEVKQPSSADTDAGSADTEKEAAETVSEEDSFVDSVTLEEVEFYNANGITVTATEIDTDSMWGVEISVLITNESDQDVTVLTRDLVVNGYNLSSSGLYEDVAAGKSANDSITLYASELEECGIETVATVEFHLVLEDSDTWADLDVSDWITLSTSAAGAFTQPIDDSGDVIYDDNAIRVICKGLKDDSIWDGELVFYVENNTDRSVNLNSENVSINGFMSDASFWVDLCPNTKAVDGMYLYDLEGLNLESIDDISEVEFSLRIIDKDTWDDIDKTDPITLHF